MRTKIEESNSKVGFDFSCIRDDNLPLIIVIKLKMKAVVQRLRTILPFFDFPSVSENGSNNSKYISVASKLPLNRPRRSLCCSLMGSVRLSFGFAESN